MNGNILLIVRKLAQRGIEPTVAKRSGEWRSEIQGYLRKP